MPNSLDSNGLTIKTLAEIVANLTAGFQALYGSDINTDSNSPDGQMINLFAQAIYDNLEVLLDTYNSFNVESAYGRSLDNLVALNGLMRSGATNTTTPVLVTVNQAVTLVGLDALGANPAAVVYTVQDDTGNQFRLVTSYVFSAAGSATLTFQAVNAGAVQVTANTITQQATVVVGVISVSNPTTTGAVVGLNEETDVALKLRRAKMFKLASTGPSDAMQAALLAPYHSPTLNAYTQYPDALVVENNTSATVNGIPPYSVYPIVTLNTDPSGPYEVPNMLYATKTPGCGLYGSATYTITRSNGYPFVANWDWSVAQPLYIRFGMTPKTAGVTFDHAVVAAELAAALVYKLGQSASIGDVITAMNNLFPTAYLTAVSVSLDGTSWADLVSPTLLKNYFTVAAANITIS